MNIYKFLKPVIPALIVVSATIFTAGCSSSSDDGASSVTPTAPAVPIDGITGIWTGSLSWETTGQSKNYDVTMMFHTAADTTEGTSMGLALGDGPNDLNTPHFLFEGGYEYSAEPITSEAVDGVSIKVTCEGDVWAIGRFGQQATFVQEFSYVTGSAGGPDQRGSGCLYLEDADGDGYENELTGQIQFEDGGKFNVALTYSEDNVRDVVLEDLGVTASDAGAYDAPDDVKYHLWSNDNSGNFMNYVATYISVGDYSLTYLTVSENHSDPLVNCGGQIVVTKIPDQNLFALRLPEGSPVSGCSLVDPEASPPANSWTQDGKTYIAYDVALPYYGLGALLDVDDDGILEFVHMMASKQSGAGSTSQVLHNKFLVQ
jgi:hypothetical protein